MALYRITYRATDESLDEVEEELAKAEAAWRHLTHPVRASWDRGDDPLGDLAPAWWDGDDEAAAVSLASMGGIAGLDGVNVSTE